MGKLTDVTRSNDIQLKIVGHSLTMAMDDGEFFSSRRYCVGGHDWEIRLRPKDPWVGRRDRPLTLKLVLRGAPRTGSGSVKAQLSCCLVDPTQKLRPSEMKTVSHKFHKPGDYSPRAVFMARDELEASGYLTDDSYVVQCAITVLREQPEIAAAAAAAGDSANAAVAPSSELHAYLGALLESKTGADVTFVVSGESFAAHKAILASRSPVFMAELFGAMKVKASERVEVKDMEAPVFKAILHFVYTDTVPELDHRDGEETEAASTATAMAQHLLAGADRYGLERLKLICESKLAERIDVDTVSTTLALAEQHDCSHLKAKCVEFIAAGTAENLDAVLATDGFKHLEASCPSVLTDLVKVARGRKQNLVTSCTIAVGGYDWLIEVFPAAYYHGTSSRNSGPYIKLRFTLSSDGERTVSATFRCRLVDDHQINQTAASASSSFKEVIVTSIFSNGQPKDMFLVSRSYASEYRYVQPDDSLLIECAITVLLEAPVNAAASVPAPLSDLQKHLGEMLTSKNGADITFLVSGEPVAAHRCVLAARSPVFMAELFGDMKEKDSQSIEIKDMEAEVFRTLLHFIYTDTLPEQDDDDVEAETMAYGLLEAADRYGVERLMLICAEKVHAGISVDTAAMALALAERHGCTKLKARCIEFILASQENFHAVAATEGYKLLMDSCPSALNDLLVAVFLRYKLTVL
nr:BTB/POZ and MATH domain-containing protein 1 [Oryza sativa Japonica Group]